MRPETKKTTETLSSSIVFTNFMHAAKSHLTKGPWMMFLRPNLRIGQGLLFVEVIFTVVLIVLDGALGIPRVLEKIKEKQEF